MEITKPNDIFSALVQKPDLNLFDLAASNVVPSNTQLLPMEDYKKLDKVQSMFKDASGKFDDKTFNAAYQKAASLYNEIGNDKALAKALEYDPTDFTAPKGALRADVAPIITKDYNPFKQLYSRTGINSVDVSDLSLRELAQQSKVYDSETKEWLDKSANDMGLMGSLVGPTMVYAQWDEGGADFDPITGRYVNHKKGDWKYNKDGNLYIETLGKREIYGKQIVNPTDLITVDGSTLGKVDFFDSDGKNKSVFGTTMKLATQVAPYLIPGVNVYYGGAKMALGLATVLPTFYKAAEALFTGDNEKDNETAMWKAMNTAQGYLAKYDVKSTSDTGTQSLWNYEQMGGMVADVFSQIYEQRAAGSLSKLFYKSNEKEYLARLANKTEDILQEVAISDAVKGVTRSKENYEHLAQVAYSKIGSLEAINKKRSELAQILNLGYMSMTQSADTYGEAIAGGYNNRTAGAAALMAAMGQFALMKNNNMGTYFLDKTTGYTEEVNKAGIRSVTRGLLEETKTAVDLLATNKEAGKKALGTVFGKAKQGFQNLLTNPISESALAEKLFKTSMIEGVEEVTEELAIDASKGIVDLMSAAGFTNKKGSFGGFDNVFSKSGFERYVSNLVGGMIGGPMFELERSFISPILSGKGIDQETKYNILQLVANGQTEELYKEIDKQKHRFGSTDLSPVVSNIDGQDFYLAKDGDSGMSQADVIANATKAYIQNVDRILNLENVKEDDESVIRKAIVDDIKIADLKKNGTDAFVKSDFNQLIGEIVELRSQLEGVADDKDGKTETGKGNLESKLNEKREMIEEILQGRRAEYYHKLSLFTLNKNLHAPFISLSVDDYVKDKYGKDFHSLSESEKKAYKIEFDNVFDESKGDFKNKMKSMFDRFLEINEEFSKSIEDFNLDGYANTRSAFLSKLRDKGKGLSLTEAYTNWQWLQQLNTTLDKNGFRTASLTSDTDMDIAHFLGDMNLIQVGLPESQRVEIIDRREALINPKIEELTKIDEQLAEAKTSEEIDALKEKGEALKNEINTDISNSDKELDQKRDINTLSTGDKEHLYAIINSLGLPSTEIDYGIIQGAFDGYNQSKAGRVKQILGEKETISQSTDLTPEDVLMQHIAKNSEITTIGNIGTIHVNGFEKKAVNKDMVKSNLLVEANKVLNDLTDVANEEGVIKFTDADRILGDWFYEETNDFTHKVIEALDNHVQTKAADVTIAEMHDVFNVAVKNKLDEISVNQGNSDPKLEEVYNEAMHSDDKYYTFTKGNDKISPKRSLLIKYANDVIAKSEDLDNEAVKELIDAANEIKSNIKNSSLGALIPDIDNFEFDENSEIGRALVDRGYKDYLNIHEILKYNKRKMNTFLDKLNEFQINLWGKTGPISFFNLLKDNYDLFDNIIAPSEFTRNNVQIDQLTKALSTISAVRSVIAAMASTEVTLGGDLYGYNVSLNAAAEKFEEVSGKFGLVDSTSAKVINDDLTFIENKLNYFKTLAERNSGALIEEQNHIKTALLSSLLKRMTDNSNVSAVKLTVNGRTLINQDDLDAINKIVLPEGRLAEFEHRIYTNFHNAEGNLLDKLDEVFTPFKGNSTEEEVINALINGKDSNLTKDLTQLETKDWYFYLHSVLALNSKDFYLNYKKLLENEVSLSEVKAPFFVQQFVQRQEQAYFNGRQGKDIMAHSIEFIQPSIDTLKNAILDNAKEAGTTITEKEAYQQAMDPKYRSFSIGYVFNVLGSAGTGKTTVLGNFPLRMIIDSKVPSETISIHALAPTVKTLTGLKENLKNQVSVEIKEDLIKDYIKTILGAKFSEYVEQLFLIEQGKYEDLNPEIFIKAEGDGAVAINEKWLNAVFLGHNIEGSKIIMIDEMSQLSTLEWQIFNYMAKNNNYYVIAMGDNLQNGSKIGDESFSTQNIATPRSIKLKSTIRSQNTHQNNNAILLENFTDAIYRKAYLDETIKFTPTLVYYDRTFLNGSKFVDTLTKADLLKLDTSKEIVFLTDSGKLSDVTQSLITNTLGIPSGDIKVYSKNVQGEEFDQVVIVDPIRIEQSRFDTIRNLYTLITRAKVGSLIVGSQDLLNDFGITTEMSLSTEPKVFDNERSKDFLTKRIEELSDMTKDYKQSNPIDHKDIKVINEKFGAVWKETEDPINDTPKAPVIKGDKDPSNVLGYSFFNNLGVYDITNHLNKTIGDATSEDSITIDDLLKSNTNTDLGSILKSVYVNGQNVDNIIGEFLKWKHSLLFSAIDNSVNPPTRLFDNNIKEKDLVIRKLKSSEYTDPYGKLVNSNTLKGKDIYVLGMNVEIGGDDHFVTLASLADENNPNVKASVDIESLSKLYRLVDKGEVVVDSEDFKTFMGVQVPEMNKAQRDAFKKTSAITVSDLQRQYPGAHISEIKVFRGPKYDAHGVLQNEDYLTYIKKTMEAYRQTAHNVQGENETNDEFTFRNSEEYYNRYTYRPYVTIEFIKGNLKYSKLVVLNAKSRSLSETWSQITIADSELRNESALKNTQNVPEHEVDVDAKYKKLALMSKYAGWKVFYDFLKSEQVAGNNVNEITDKMINHIAWKNYLNKRDLETFHIENTLNDLATFINSDTSTQKTFDDLLENPKLKSIIGNRFRDLIPVKIPNPLYVIHNIMLEKNSENEILINSFNAFIQTYDKPIYYNTIIDSPDVSGRHEGNLPKSTYDNYEMQYPIEANQIMFNVNKILNRLNVPTPNVANVITEPTVAGVEMPNHITFDFEGDSYGVPLGNLFDKVKDVAAGKAVIVKVLNAFVAQNEDDIDIENGMLKFDGMNLSSLLGTLFEVDADKKIKLNGNHMLSDYIDKSRLGETDQFNCKF